MRANTRVLELGGEAAYFNKEGEPGRKITCKECHDAKAPPDGDEATRQ